MSKWIEGVLCRDRKSREGFITFWRAKSGGPVPRKRDLFLNVGMWDDRAYLQTHKMCFCYRAMFPSKFEATYGFLPKYGTAEEVFLET